ncbi:hypothetical protein EN844_06525 [Mesorhizobium sp. M3A.F.Ca.ET.201.01.1.1]|uniref:hypothetical protein n=1 Tax=Mesorhizobium sp. M3A.F.Ca.ET.201.01.1.1 TaxID=2563946 RepID=UPI0010936844|nr:hypothetical protein [Mesorhizobium sp. M3A.F.Ca.ET.201.01.1.1]TGS70391.1 hypothetical protein EN844_06525 [Mesorhizobium sp. M3A.F.Ca.ET.201.01.1.1]
MHKIAEQCGVKILKPDLHRKSEGKTKVCFCPKTLKMIGRAHGADHLRLVLRLIVESDGNAGELQMETITAVSNVVLSNLVEIRADLFDDVNLGELRAWAAAVKPRLCTTVAALTSALLLIFAGPDLVLPAPAEPDPAEERRREILRKSRANAKRRRLRRDAFVAAAILESS